MRLFLLVLVVLLFPYQVFSQQTATIGDAAELCLHEIQKAEKKYHIPFRLLEAIALTESGRKLQKKEKPVPWPWTVTANCKGRYFATKADAIRAVRKLQQRGVRTIDVGCMQISLLHHPEAFRNLHEAFDIAQNISYGAKFLCELRKQHASWAKAVGCYHSASIPLHASYKRRVLDIWKERHRSFFDSSTSGEFAHFFASEKMAPRHLSPPLTHRRGHSRWAMSTFYALLNRRASMRLYGARSHPTPLAFRKISLPNGRSSRRQFSVSASTRKSDKPRAARLRLASARI